MREAHAIDGSWPMGRVQIEDPVTDIERQKVASSCVADLKLPMRAVVDKVDDKVGAAYQGHPDRLYLVGLDGKVAYAGGRGPFGFKPEELEDAIIEEMIHVRDVKRVEKQKQKQRSKSDRKRSK